MKYFTQISMSVTQDNSQIEINIMFANGYVEGNRTETCLEWSRSLLFSVQLFFSPSSLLYTQLKPFKYEGQAALFKDPVRTAQ